MNGYRRNVYGDPWYRGYMPRSYIPPHRLASFSCSIGLIVFGMFFLFGGTVAILMSKRAANTFKKQNENPAFDDEFFRRHREKNKRIFEDDVPSLIHIIGVIFLCFGSVCIISALGICFFARHYMNKQGNRQTNNAGASLNQGLTQDNTYRPPPPGSYPHQPAPPPGSYPQQSVPPGPYTQQSASSYPYSQYVPPPGSYPQGGINSYPQPSAPPTIQQTYPPTIQQSGPVQPYPNEKPPQYEQTTTYLESQAPSTTNPPAIGFK